MPKLSIAWQSLPTGVRFEVLESRFLKQSQVVRAADWVQNIDAKSGVGLAQLVAWLDDGTGERDGEGLVVPHGVIAGLSESRAEKLALPPVAPYVLSIEHQGTIDQSDFRLGMR